MPELKRMGVATVFTPGATTTEIVDWVARRPGRQSPSPETQPPCAPHSRRAPGTGGPTSPPPVILDGKAERRWPSGSARTVTGCTAYAFL